MTTDELAVIVERLLRQEISPDDLMGALDMTDSEKQLVLAEAHGRLRELMQGSRLHSFAEAQGKAMGLLRGLLTSEQRKQLRQTGRFVVCVPSGRAYRLRPKYGDVERVVRHGKVWAREGRYCYHEEEDEPETLRLRTQPPADRTVSHLLTLIADEDRFLLEANWTEARNKGWDQEWQKELRAARRQRQFGCDTCGGKHIAKMCDERRSRLNSGTRSTARSSSARACTGHCPSCSCTRPSTTG